MSVEFSDTGTGERNAAEASLNPVIQQLQMETSVTLELGTPMVVSSFQDPASKHNFQIEATAIRTKTQE